jgi:hypothetical protein
MQSILNKTTGANSPNLKKETAIQIQEVFSIPKRQDQKRTNLTHIIVKTLSIQNKERILKAAREQ